MPALTSALCRSFAAVLILTALSGCIAEGPLPVPSRPAATSPPPSLAPEPSSSVPASLPSASPSGDLGPALTPVATASPSLPADALRRSARVDVDGVRVGIVLDRNPMPAGEPTWVTTRVTNTGDDDLIWFHDGCSITVGVLGSILGIRWNLGRAQVDAAKAWKVFLVDGHGANVDPVNIAFTPEQFVGKGTVGCADIGLEDRIRPGQTIEQRAQWNGLAYRQLIPPPTARVDLVGSFRYYWRAREGQPNAIIEQVIDVHLDAWIVGTGEAFIGPWQAVDVALLDPRLTAILADRHPGQSNSSVLRYVSEIGAYEVGILDTGDEPNTRARVHLSLIDARTGRIVGFVDRDWDYRVEGSP